MSTTSTLPQPYIKGDVSPDPPVSRLSSGLISAQRETGIDCTANKNPKSLGHIHPQPGNEDVKLSLPYEKLRGAMFFPETWKTKIAKQPVILVPPTGLYGGTAYRDNLAKLLTQWPATNPMWLNVPDAMANWTWLNSEYVVYAIHYIYQYTKKKVALIAWSQGNLASQWALTWWPSTRALVNNFISISADFHGTLTAYVTTGFWTAPSILNQKYWSQFVIALREHGGDAAWVPHTSIFSSGFDEIVQPQKKNRASAYIRQHPNRKVETTNVDVRAIPNKTWTKDFAWFHGTLVFHPMVWELIKDAISNGGPAKLDRVKNKDEVNKRLYADGLDPGDILKSLDIMRKFVPNLLKFWPNLKRHEEDLPAYALSKNPNNVLRMVKPPTEMSPEDKAIVEHAKKYSKLELKAMVNHATTNSEHDAEKNMVIPCMFDIDVCLKVFWRQMQIKKAATVPPVPGL